jgi:predicted amidohydrolase
MQAWRVLLAARAIENQCYVLGVNRIGKDPYCEYSGGTCVVDPFGFANVCQDNEPQVLTQTLDLKRLKSFRQKFPVLKEMDSI